MKKSLNILNKYGGLSEGQLKVILEICRDGAHLLTVVLDNQNGDEIFSSCTETHDLVSLLHHSFKNVIENVIWEIDEKSS